MLNINFLPLLFITIKAPVHYEPQFSHLLNETGSAGSEGLTHSRILWFCSEAFFPRIGGGQ